MLNNICRPESQQMVIKHGNHYVKFRSQFSAVQIELFASVSYVLC